MYEKMNKVDVRIGRFFNVYGYGQDVTSSYSGVLTHFSTAMRNGSRIKVYGDGSNVRDYVYVKDVVSAMIFMMRQDSIYRANIGTGSGSSVTDVIKVLAEYFGQYPEIEWCPPRQGDPACSVANVSVLSNLGWRAKYSLTEGVSHWLSGKGNY